MSMNQIASDLYKALSESDQRKVKPYDVKAEVLRTEGDIVWVKIPGGIDETPVQKTNNANPGDQVIVRVAGGRAWLLGNNTSPATDDSTANLSLVQAGEALVGAKEAQDLANVAYSDAVRAHEAADQASDDALRAYNAATAAQTSADNAQASATAAQTSADSATRSANTALTELSIVEDVVGTLQWIQDHGEYILTEDTSVENGKVYFLYNSTTQDYEPIISPDPTKNPSEEGWYELDLSSSTVTDYILAHLAVTNRGLWVLPSGKASGTTPASGETQEDSDARQSEKSKVLLANDGLHVYDSNGDEVSIFGESIYFNANKSQRIGGLDTYIDFNSQSGTLTIGGSNLVITGTDVLNASQVMFDAPNQKTVADELGTMGDIKNSITVDTSEPSITIGNPLLYAVKITDTELDFISNSEPVAYVSGQELYIPRVVVLRSMQAGNWFWDAASNENHLTLRWNELQQGGA